MGLKRYVTGSNVDVSNLHPTFAARVEAFLDACPYHVRIRSAYRTIAQQVAIKAKSGAMAARPGFSAHNVGLAVDFTLPAGAYSTPAAQWCYRNAHRFGINFSLLPQSVAQATGNNSRARTVFEAWHAEPVEFVLTVREGNRLVNHTFGERIVVTDLPLHARFGESPNPSAAVVAPANRQPVVTQSKSAEMLLTKFTVKVNGGRPKGLVAEGNIDLTTRPLHGNPDGSVSTVRSITVGFDDVFVVLPTIADNGTLLSDEQAIDAFRKTHRSLGMFDSEAHATAYAKLLHEEQDVYASEKRLELMAVASGPTTGAISSFSRAGSQAVRYGTGDPEKARYRSAFLDVLALSERTAHDPDNGYRTIVGHRLFTSYANHPGVSTQTKYGRSDAAGRYQFLGRTWRNLGGVAKYGDFGPISQDRAALDLAHSVLPLIDRGEIITAVERVNGIWTSLPGGPQQITSVDQVFKWWTDALAGARIPTTLDEIVDPIETEPSGTLGDIIAQRVVELGAVGLDVALLQRFFDLPVTGIADVTLIDRVASFLAANGTLPTRLVVRLGAKDVGYFGLRWAG